MARAALNVAVFGVGFGAYCLAPAFQRDPRLAVTALCSPSPERRQSALERFNIPAGFASPEALFNGCDIDIAAIAVPPQQQQELALACLERGIAVLAEKPLSADLPGAVMMAGAAADAGVPTAVDFLFPELACWREAKQRLDQGRIGALRHLVVNWHLESHDVRHGLRSWKTDSGAGGGVMAHFGCHTLYYLEWLCGPIDSMTASLERAATFDLAGDTLATLALRFTCGMTASVSLSIAAPFGSGHTVEIYGDDGRLALVNRSSDHMKFHLQETQRHDGTMKDITPSEGDAVLNSGDDPRIAPVSRIASRLADAVIDGTRMKPDFDDGLRVQLLLDRINQNANLSRDNAARP